MRKILTLGVIFMICLGCEISSAANIKDYPRVAVMNFGNKAVMSSGLRETDFSAATEYAIYQFAASGWFDLIDYEELSAAAKMHSVNMSGLIDQTTAPAIGKFLGAQFMVIGNLTGLTTKENVVGYQHGKKGGLDTNEHVVTANVSMRIVDIETGRIIVAGLGKGSSTSSHTEVSFKKYRRKRNDSETTTVKLSMVSRILKPPLPSIRGWLVTPTQLKKLPAAAGPALIPSSSKRLKRAAAKIRRTRSTLSYRSRTPTVFLQQMQPIIFS